MMSCVEEFTNGLLLASASNVSETNFSLGQTTFTVYVDLSCASGHMFLTLRLVGSAIISPRNELSSGFEHSVAMLFVETIFRSFYQDSSGKAKIQS